MKNCFFCHLPVGDDSEIEIRTVIRDIEGRYSETVRDRVHADCLVEAERCFLMPEPDMGPRLVRKVSE